MTALPRHLRDARGASVNAPTTVFEIEFPIVSLTIAQIWPDGDGPENPTVEDVLEVMRGYGSPERVVDEWDLLLGEGFTVNGVQYR